MIRLLRRLNKTPQQKQTSNNRFHDYCGLSGDRYVQLLFHRLDEDLSPGTPDLTEKLCRAPFHETHPL
jgi:hypothetical protein